MFFNCELQMPGFKRKACFQHKQFASVFSHHAGRNLLLKRKRNKILTVATNNKPQCYAATSAVSLPLMEALLLSYSIFLPFFAISVTITTHTDNLGPDAVYCSS